MSLLREREAKKEAADYTSIVRFSLFYHRQFVLLFLTYVLQSETCHEFWSKCNYGIQDPEAKNTTLTLSTILDVLRRLEETTSKEVVPAILTTAVAQLVLRRLFSLSINTATPRSAVVQISECLARWTLLAGAGIRSLLDSLVAEMIEAVLTNSNHRLQTQRVMHILHSLGPSTLHSETISALQGRLRLMQLQNAPNVDFVGGEVFARHARMLSTRIHKRILHGHTTSNVTWRSSGTVRDSLHKEMIEGPK